MKSRIITFLLIIFSFTSYSQPYESIFGSDSTKWNIFHIIYDGGTTFEYYVNGDTLIDSLFYKKIFRDYSNNNIGYIREDTTKGKTWFKLKNDTIEILLMDLSLSVGDSFELTDVVSFSNPDYNKIPHIVKKVNYLNGDKIIEFEITGYVHDTLRFIEQVGPSHGIVPYEYFQYKELICAHKDSELVYQKYDTCYIEWYSINEITENESLIFPNPFSKQTTLHTNNFLNNATLTIYNYFGQTVKQIINISGQTITLHRDNLPGGLYFIRLTQDNKMITTDKLIITN